MGTPRTVWERLTLCGQFTLPAPGVLARVPAFDRELPLPFGIRLGKLDLSCAPFQSGKVHFGFLPSALSRAFVEPPHFALRLTHGCLLPVVQQILRKSS